MREIANTTKNWLPRSVSMRAWEIFNNYHILPYAGGWLDQPQWLLTDFENLWLIQEFHTLNSDLADGKSLPPLQGFVKGQSNG